MAEEKVIRKYGERVGYTDSEIEKFYEGGHRIRQVSRLSRATAKYSIQAEVVNSKNCNSGHIVGQTFVLIAHRDFAKLVARRPSIALLRRDAQATEPEVQSVSSRSFT